MKYCFLLLAVTLISGCNSLEKSDEIDQLISNVSNEDVEVDGSIGGLLVSIETPESKKLISLGGGAVPQLKDALKNKKKFAAAHIILTLMLIESYEISEASWNKLKVNLYSNGKIQFYPEQIPELLEYWDGITK